MLVPEIYLRDYSYYDGIFEKFTKMPKEQYKTAFPDITSDLLSKLFLLLCFHISVFVCTELFLRYRHV